MKILNSKSVVISAVLALAAFGCERKPKVESTEAPASSSSSTPAEEGVGGSGNTYAPPTADPSRPQDMPDNNSNLSGQSAPPAGTESGSSTGSGSSTTTPAPPPNSGSMGTGTGVYDAPSGTGGTGSHSTPQTPPDNGSMGTGNGVYDSSGASSGSDTSGTGGSSDAGR